MTEKERQAAIDRLKAGKTHPYINVVDALLATEAMRVEAEQRITDLEAQLREAKHEAWANEAAGNVVVSDAMAAEFDAVAFMRNMDALTGGR